MKQTIQCGKATKDAVRFCELHFWSRTGVSGLWVIGVMLL